MSTTDTGESNQPTTETQAPATPDVNQIVNAAVSSHLKRFTEKQLPSILEAAFKPLAEQLAKPQAAPEAPSGEPKNSKSNPEVTALTQQLEQMKAQFTREAEARKAAEAKTREDRAYNEFKSHLAKGVRPEMVDMVTDYLFRVKKMVEVGEDGTAIVKGTRNHLGYEEEVAYPLAAGVDNWLKSDAAKGVIPAQGSTSTAPATPRRPMVQTGSTLPANFDLANATPEQKAQAAKDLEAQISQLLASKGMSI